MTEGISAEETAQLQERLELLERRQRAITNKETLRELQYEAAEVRWRLGLMTDEEFEELEEFHDSFTFDF
jgi:hypothetical protein